MNHFDFYFGKKIDNPLIVSILLLLLTFIVYLYQGIAPAFNADDVIQIQYPEDTYTFLAQGRWGYFLLFGKLFQSNPVPVLATFLGAGMLVMTGIYACRMLEFSRYASVSVLVAVSAISVYYGYLFSFDSTRIAYPIANLLAVYGLYATANGKPLKGIFLMSLAPAFYPVASELAATVFMAFLTVKLTNTKSRFPIRQGFLLGISILTSLILYAAITHLIAKLSGHPLSTRTQMDFLAALHRSREILCLFTQHSFPILTSIGPDLPGYPAVFPTVVALIIFALFAAFIILAIRILLLDGKINRVYFLVLLQIGLVVMPFGLIFCNKDSPFPPRALYPFAMVHGFYAAFVLERLLDEKSLRNTIQTYTVRFVLILAGIFLFFNAANINMRAFNEYLGSRSELLMANRVLMRIENTIADNPRFTKSDHLPLAVIDNKATLVGPRGNVGAVMPVPWAKERLFHFLDRRITVAGEEKQELAQKAAETHGEWPASNSVFILDDFIVVVVHK
jgi:Glucosyl transferase GtrII